MGFVQNLPDGRVKVVAEGDEPALERFLNDLSIKDPLIDVRGIESNYTSAMGDFIRFEKMVANGETDQCLDKEAKLLELLSDLIVVSKQIVTQLMINNEETRGVREEVKGGSSLFRVGNRIVESSVSSPCALCLCGGERPYPLVITSGERRSTTETQSSQSTHRAPNQELENHSNLRLATGNSEEP